MNGQSACPLGIRQLRRNGFSLMELLAVICIIGAISVVSLPTVVSVMGQVGRKGAVAQLLNTFEQARVAALEQGASTYIVFADSNFPIVESQYRCYVVVRESGDFDPPGTPPFVPLTKWQQLPKGISFKSNDGGILQNASTKTFTGIRVPDGTVDPRLPYIKFSSRGTIASPTAGALQLFLYEGFYDSSSNSDRATTAASGSSGGNPYLERVSLSRFTGRARVDLDKSLVGT